MAIISQLLATFVSCASALSMSPMFPYFTKEFDLNDTQLLLLTGVCILAFAYANFIIVPCSNIFGRRTTFLAFTAISIASYIWQARATSYPSLLVARVLNGIGAATNETIPVQTIAEMFFLHERGRWMMAYFSTTSLGAYLGPVISGNITQRFGWRSFFWLSMALTCFNFLTILICYPETKYRRDYEWELRQACDLSLPSEKTPNDITPPVDVPCKGFFPTQTTPTIPEKGSPSRTQFALWQSPDPRWKAFLLRDILTPVRVCIYPIIFWAGATVAGTGNVILLWNLTESTVLSAPPYNFTPSEVGYSNFSFVVGVVIGLVTAGPLSDWVAMKATSRNNGIYEAEMRLFALIPFFAIFLVSVLVGAFAISHLWPWPVILVVGYGLSGLFSAAIASIAVAYAVDCYKPISGEIMIVVIVVRNTCGFSMSYWFALTVGPLVLGLLVYWFGKRLRVLTRNSSVHLRGE
ncbi:MFS general substrate transporter [Aspergillus sclerotiicarbonarius CBS 121057]|uniref:MFS general substrate transporter n=1 Tax=Aspergillus sclerotiicarbonarius (strain CBS 121057 / IBT 28362) TaxID=1448318 RepID=A0A319DXI9_ASPSB|nr:MFS general substrate transporter [Aspergillus sclerotiicarbonarius CBS 121057]